MLRRVAARRQENGLVQELIKGSVNCRLWVVIVVGHERSGPRSPGGVDENATRDLDKPGSHWTFVLHQSRRWRQARTNVSWTMSSAGSDRR